MTEGYVDGGRLEIQVVADFKELAGKLRAGVLAASQDVSAQVGVDLVTTARGKGSKALKTRLKEAAAEAGAGVSASVDVDVKPTRLKGKIKDAVKGLDLSVDVKLNPVATGLKAKLKKLAKENDVTITAKVEPSKGAARALQQARDQAAGQDLLTKALLRTQKAAYGNEDAERKLAEALRIHGRESNQAERAANQAETAQHNLNDQLKSTAQLLKQIKGSKDLQVDTSRVERELANLRARAGAVQAVIAESPAAPHGDDAAAARNARALDDARNKLNRSLLAGVGASDKLRDAQQGLADAEANHGRRSEEYLAAEKKLNVERQRSKESLQNIARAIEGLRDSARVLDVDVERETAGAAAEADRLSRARSAAVAARVDDAAAARNARALDDARNKLNRSLLAGVGASDKLRDAQQGLADAEAQQGRHSDQYREAEKKLNVERQRSKESLQNIARAIDGLKDSAQVVKVPVETETAKAEAELQRLSRDRSATVTARIAKVDTAASEKELREVEDAVGRLRAALNSGERSTRGLEVAMLKQAIAARAAKTDTDGLHTAVVSFRDAVQKSETALTRARRELAALQDLAHNNPTISVDADIAAAQARIAELERNHTAIINAKLDDKEAKARLAILTRPEDKTVNVKADTGRATGVMALFSGETSFAEARVLGLAGAITFLGPAIAPLGAAAVGAVAGIGAAAVAAAAGVGVLVLAFSGVKSSLDALQALDQARAKDSAKNAKADAQQQYAVAGATDQVTAATDALKNARDNAAASALTSAQRITDAQDGVAAAERGVTDAERDAADAQVRAKDAQDALTKARKDARQAAQDLALQVRGGALAVRAATLEEARSRKALDKVLKDPKSTKDAREAAQLAHDQDVLNLDEQTLRNKRLQEERAKSAKQGIEGSDGVTKALKGVAAANRDVGDAQVKVTGAQAKVAKAEREVTEARRAAATQARQSAAAITSAQRSLVSSQRALAKATTTYGDEASAALLKVRKELDAQSESGKKFILFLDGLRPILADLKAAAQAGLFPGLESGIKALMPLLPGLNTFIANVAGSLGRMFEAGAKALGSPAWQNFFDYMQRTAGPFLESLGRTLTSASEGFASLLVAFEPVSRRFISGLEDMARSFADWAAGLQASDRFQAFMDYISQVGPEIADVVLSLARALFSVLEALAPIGDAVLGGLKVLFDLIADAPTGLLTVIALGIMGIVAALIAYNVLAAVAQVATNLLTGAIVLLESAAAPLLIPLYALIAGFAIFAAGLAYAYTQSQEVKDNLAGVFRSIDRTITDVFAHLGFEGGRLSDLIVGYFENITRGALIWAQRFEENYLTYIKPTLDALGGDLGALSRIGDGTAYQLQRVADAEQELADANATAKGAQDDLNESRRAGAERLQDLIALQAQQTLDLKGAKISTRDAILNLRKLYAERAKKKAKGEKFTEDDAIALDRAKLAVEQAQAREATIKKNQAKTAAEKPAARTQSNFGTPEAARAAEDAGDAARLAQEKLDALTAPAKESGHNFAKGFIDGVLDSLFGKDTWIRKIVDRILKDWRESLGIASPSTVMYEIGQDTIQGFIDGAQATALELLSWWLELPGRLLAAIKTALGIASPSTEMSGVGTDAIQGFIDGATGRALSLVTFFATLPSRLLDAVSGFGGELKTWAQTAMDTAKGVFGTGVTAIGAAWDKIQEVLKKPVGFVLNTVLENGLFKAFNDLASIFPGITPIHLSSEVLKKFPAAATGAIVPGYTPGRDTGVIAVGGGEAILRPELTRELGADWVHQGNRAARTGGRGGARRFLGGYAGGGLVPELTSFAGKSGVPFRVSSGLRNTNDYHGRGMAIDMVASGPDMLRLASWLYGRYKNLLELIHSAGPGFFVKNGEKVGASYYRSVLADHFDHVHLAMSQAGLAAAGLDPGTSGGAFTALLQDKLVGLASSLLPKIGLQGSPMGQILSGIPAKVIGVLATKGGELLDKVPLVGKAADAAARLFSTVTGTASAVAGKIGSFLGSLFSSDKGGKSGVAGLPAPVSRWTPLVIKALTELGQNPGLAPAVLRRIQFESGGNPAAINLTDSNALAGHPSQGLMQTIPSTFAAHAGPYRSRGINDPLANIYAGLHYALGRYGSIAAIDPLVRPYGYDTGGKLAPGWSAVYNGTGKPEVVLTDGQWQTLSRIAASAVLPTTALRGSYAGQIAGRSVPAGAAAAAPAQPTVINVYPRASHSEREIGRIVNRELEWSRGPS